MSNMPKLYAVVEFCEIFIDGKKVVELVPISWLTSDETLCFWPPTNLEYKSKELIEIQADADDTWDTYPIAIITKAKDYKKGNRKLKKYLKKRNGDSSESESQASRDDQIVITKSSRVAKTLAKANPMPLMRDPSIEDILEESSAEDNNAANNKEFKKMRQSLELSMTDKFEKLLKTIQYSGEAPAVQKAWQDLSNTLPFDSLEKFLAFEESLITDKQKKNSLLLYSGCGKRFKGVGKRSFKDTESFKIIEEFLRAKHHASQRKLEIISWVSKFLSGAKDREGGRALRENKTNEMTE
ncbi:Protein of unknown function [Cotesia congregata]|uniref:Uncharacterized protein n=1 Tax=Cotesia congregata TaxID=51543 RepID=A0A8J2H5G1_COTCN|nr:Protein of unknown function [Cotesia congregata]